ncbi:MAG: DUF1573 domain-containing protein [Patescibacteria group bacterium]|nr:DUF1573 domain-containing protein [Patescibacteria group bacterium]
MNKKIALILVVLALGSAIIFIFNHGMFDNEGFGLKNKDNNINITENIKNGPLIEVDQKYYDFGIVKYGDVAKHIFKITNVGTENLEILKLSTSCGCTKASITNEDKIILPGKSVDMIVTFDPAVHKDDTDFGELHRIVYIRTNDLENSEIEVEITANVIK